MSRLSYAEIAIPGLLRRTLTYGIPDQVAGSIHRGTRALVPLGKRIVTGYCLEVHDRKPDIAVRPVREALDSEPVFPETILRLAAWIHEYYGAPIGDALKAALPQGIDRESEGYVHIATEDLDAAIESVARSKKKTAVLDLLRTGEYMSFMELQLATGYRDLSSAIHDLESRGFVKVESVVPPSKVHAKKILAVRLIPPWIASDRFREVTRILERRAPVQVNVLMVLWQERAKGRESVPMAELVRAARASSAQVRALEEKEIVAVFHEETVRVYRPAFEETARVIELTRHQKEAVERIVGAVDEKRFCPFLLHGVTASGKTQVYIEVIRHVIAGGRNALVLVPEIALTPQLVHRFQSAFGESVTVIHSRLSLGERFDAWRLTRKGTFRVLVGVRSAVFAPLDNVGVIVVDEEHETSYKQSDMQPRYHARDTAVMRARIEEAAIVLGSATPSCESYHNARTHKYSLIEMPERVVHTLLPVIQPVDLVAARRENAMKGLLTPILIGKIRERMEKREGVIILQNRRGFAPYLECRDCAFVQQCENCSISMTYHKVPGRLRCHYCGSASKVPEICPRCGGVDLDAVGAGTQRIEEEMTELFPGARIVRMDLDTTTRKGSHDLILTAFYEGRADILLGTQMVSKGLDFPRVTLVGVINADLSLLLPDFRAAERTFQLLTQVAGRSGRGTVPGEVVIQTSQGDHRIISHVLEHDYTGFIEGELESRRRFHYPPYSRLLLLEFSGEREEDVVSAARRYAAVMPRSADLFHRHDPTPAAIYRINRRYRYHILFKVNKEMDPGGAKIHRYLHDVRERVRKEVKGTSVLINIDVDPQQLL